MRIPRGHPPPRAPDNLIRPHHPTNSRPCGGVCRSSRALSSGSRGSLSARLLEQRPSSRTSSSGPPLPPTGSFATSSRTCSLRPTRSSSSAAEHHHHHQQQQQQEHQRLLLLVQQLPLRLSRSSRPKSRGFFSPSAAFRPLLLPQCTARGPTPLPATPSGPARPPPSSSRHPDQLRRPSAPSIASTTHALPIFCRRRPSVPRSSATPSSSITAPAPPIDDTHLRRQHVYFIAIR